MVAGVAGSSPLSARRRSSWRRYLRSWSSRSSFRVSRMCGGSRPGPSPLAPPLWVSSSVASSCWKLWSFQRSESWRASVGENLSSAWNQSTTVAGSRMRWPGWEPSRLMKRGADEHGAIEVGVAAVGVGGGSEVCGADGDLGPVKRGLVGGAVLGDLEDEFEVAGLTGALLALGEVLLQPDRSLLDEPADGDQRIALLDRPGLADRVALGRALQCLTSAEMRVRYRSKNLGKMPTEDGREGGGAIMTTYVAALLHGLDAVRREDGG